MNEAVAATDAKAAGEDHDVAQINAMLAGEGSIEGHRKRHARREKMVLAMTVLGVCILVAGLGAALVQPSLDADYAQGVPPGAGLPLVPLIILIGVCVLAAATVAGFLVHARRPPAT